MITGVEIPCSKESEMTVLGCMFNSDNDLKMAVERLEESDFYYKEHKIIFRVLKQARPQDKGSDVLLIYEELQRQGLLSTVGSIEYLTELVQRVGTSTRIEEYIGLIKTKSMHRRAIQVADEAEYKAPQASEDVLHTIKEAKGKLTSIENAAKSPQLPLTKMDERLLQLDEKLEQFRGKKYLGLCQKTIPEIDEKTLGLRKLLLIAAAPNVGKTALTIQLALDILKNHRDACLVYFSLEMSSMDIFIRMLCNLSQLDYKTLIFGSNNQNTMLMQSGYFKAEEWDNIEGAIGCLREIGDRLQIIDGTQMSFIDSESAISFIHELKAKTRSKRVIVVVDYLQIWPMNSKVKVFSEIEIDKWRIEEIKKICAAINDDPVLVISEARKPPVKGSAWGGDLSDVMGSARVTYSPDGVMLLKQLNAEDVSKLVYTESLEKKVPIIEKYLLDKGVSICQLELIKARDGMQRFNLLLVFQHRKNMFVPTNKEHLQFELEGRRK